MQKKHRAPAPTPGNARFNQRSPQTAQHNSPRNPRARFSSPRTAWSEVEDGERPRCRRTKPRRRDRWSRCLRWKPRLVTVNSGMAKTQITCGGLECAGQLVSAAAGTSLRMRDFVRFGRVEEGVGRLGLGEGGGGSVAGEGGGISSVAEGGFTGVVVGFAASIGDRASGGFCCDVSGMGFPVVAFTGTGFPVSATRRVSAITASSGF